MGVSGQGSVGRILQRTSELFSNRLVDVLKSYSLLGTSVAVVVSYCLRCFIAVCGQHGTWVIVFRQIVIFIGTCRVIGLAVGGGRWAPGHPHKALTHLLNPRLFNSFMTQSPICLVFLGLPSSYVSSMPKPSSRFMYLSVGRAFSSMSKARFVTLTA